VSEAYADAQDVDGFATMLLSLVSIARDGEWTASRPVVYATYVACVVVHGLITTFFARIMPKIQTLCIVSNIGLVVATVIALPVGKAMNGGPVNSGSYVFGHVENLTTWPAGWAFMLAWLSPIWTIGAFDSCVHMSEEATHATRAVPLGILWSIGLCGILGFLSLAVIAAVMDTKLDNVLGTAFGQPMAQVSLSGPKAHPHRPELIIARSTTTHSANPVPWASWPLSPSFSSSWA
jgi:amino acid transporter